LISCLVTSIDAAIISPLLIGEEFMGCSKCH